jgi:GNAT superfamily N-acetyltransferase
LKTGKLEIRDVGLENTNDLINLCIPQDKEYDPLFIKGMNVKRKWATQVIEKYGSVAKLAYLNSKPVGLIQYCPKLEEKLVEITCIFIPERENLRKGIGRSLLRALIEDMRKPRPIFNDDIPQALVTWAFQIPEWYPQHEFYQRIGFKRVREDDPFLLYYPLKNGYVYFPEEERFIPQEEDEGMALIFYDPSCPFAIYFLEKIKESIREVAPDIPIRAINKSEEWEEVKKRGQVPFCVINKKPIRSFFMDKENFQKEVKKALSPTI